MYSIVQSIFKEGLPRATGKILKKHFIFYVIIVQYVNVLPIVHLVVIAIKFQT